MRRFLLLIFFFFMPTLHAEIIDLDTTALKIRLAEGVVVIDIRTAEEWRDTGIIKESHPLQFFDKNGQAAPDVWLEKLKGIAPPEQPIVLICRSGNRSKIAARYLETKGYQVIYNAADGIKGWLREGLPLQNHP